MPEADTSYHPIFNPNLEVHRRSGPITIDGDLNDAGWKNAARSDVFTEALPIPNKRARQRTEALITYDSNYLYIAMIAYDDHPERIRASMVNRDQIWDDDFMGIILDTYGDATRAFEVYTNPLGVQGDLFWTTNSEDQSYDMVFNAESKITSDGWQTEIRIPFSSLRFPDKTVQNFHVSFWRNWPRDADYKFSWAPINFFIPCAFCQLGSLTGIESIRPAGTLELLPALVASQDATISDPGIPDSRLTNGPVLVKPSLGIRYAIGPATGLEAAIKPDFSQVEADQAQVSVNSTFALFYPEHRPFFQDGSDLYSTLLPAVYTRSINSPLAVAKAIHRDATTSFLYLSGYDEHSPVIIPLEERSIILPDVGKSLSNILRVSHSFANDAYLGILGTDRRYENNGSNTVGGLDGRVNLFENVELLGQALLSYTQESNTHQIGSSTLFDNGRHTVELDGEHYLGDMSYFALQRYTQTVDLHAEYAETSPTFRAGNGFVTANDFRGVLAWAGDKYPLVGQPHWMKWLQEVDGTFTVAQDWNFDAITKRKAYRAQLDISLIGQTALHIFYRGYTERFQNITFPGLHQWDLTWITKFDQSIAMGGEVTLGRIIARTVSPPSTGKEADITFWVRLKPFERILIEPTWTFSQLTSDSGGQFYSGSIYFARISYQFSRDLNFRAIVQYDNFARQFDVDPLITYKVNPFTSFYIGSTHTYSAFDETSPLRATDRQFFAKVQYLFQT